MTTTSPSVNVNLIAHNNVLTIGETIECVLAQTWRAISLTVIDNGSDDETVAVAERYVSKYPNVRIKRNRCNVGQVANVQRAFWLGDDDFVMPKTADDLIAPDYIERLMAVLSEFPDCVMCHGAGMVFTKAGQVDYYYPPEHRLNAIGLDAMARVMHVMQHYTSAPSFWGIYRRDAVDRLSMMRYRAGFDHVVLAELALHGEIRSVPEPLYWRRGGGQPVLRLARATTGQGNRGVPLDDVLGEHRWRTPLITTAYAHMEAFAEAPLPLSQRQELMRMVPIVFRARWLPQMQREAAELHKVLPYLLRGIASTEPNEAAWLARTLSEVLIGAQAILPEEDFTVELLEVAAVTGEAIQVAVKSAQPPIP